MAEAQLSVSFQNAAGSVLEHPAGYAVLRYAAGKRQPGQLQDLIAQLGRLLLRRGWHKFLADNRLMAPFSAAEKEWFVTQWLGHQIARPAPLTAAVLLPTEVVARLSFMEMYTQAGATSLRYVTFTDPDQATAYLAKV